MKTIKGPAIFLAQFMGDKPPFDTLTGLADWAAGLGFRGLQLPTDPRLFDLTRAATSQDYCDETSGLLAERRWSSQSSPPICRGSCWRSTPPMTPCLMVSPPRRCASPPASGRIFGEGPKTREAPLRGLLHDLIKCHTRVSFLCRRCGRAASSPRRATRFSW